MFLGRDDSIGIYLRLSPLVLNEYIFFASRPTPRVLVLQLNVYLNRKFPGKSLSDGGDGDGDAGDRNYAAEEATKVSTADNDEPPAIDAVNSQYPVNTTEFCFSKYQLFA